MPFTDHFAYYLWPLGGGFLFDQAGDPLALCFLLAYMCKYMCFVSGRQRTRPILSLRTPLSAPHPANTVLYITYIMYNTALGFSHDHLPVSYTHLTLPTI